MFLKKEQRTEFSDLYGTGDVVGYRANVDTNELFFTKNRARIGKLPQYSSDHKPDMYNSRIRREIAS